MDKIKEGSAEIYVSKDKKISKKLPVFYNPVMKFNRDVSVLILNSIDKKNMQIADPLAASGIRSIRFLKELKKGIIKSISVNDYDEDFFKKIKKNLRLNKIKKTSKIKISNKDANLFLLESTGFDYIDIDPFGTPNPFLDAAIRRLARDGILAVTATDTSALCGTFPKVCERKYWANPKHDEQMYEFGLRILIRKIQLIGAQYEKALVPIFSYTKDHYMRVFLKCDKSKQSVDNIIKQHKHIDNYGPIWTGKLWDNELLKNIFNKNNLKNKELINFLKIIKEESKIDTVGYYDIHSIIKKYKIKKIPKKKELIEKIRKLGFKASETIFLDTAIKSDISDKKFLKLLKK